MGGAQVLSAEPPDATSSAPEAQAGVLPNTAPSWSQSARDRARARLEAFIRKQWPESASLPADTQVQLVAELSLALLSIPLAIGSLAVLIMVTNFGVIVSQWPVLLVMLLLGIVLNEVSFFQVVGLEGGRYSYNSTSLSGVLMLSALLIYGAVAIWLIIPLLATHYLRRIPRSLSLFQRWNWVRNLTFNVWSSILSLLGGLGIYRLLGGEIPLPGIALSDSWPAFVAMAVILALNFGFVSLLFAVQGAVLERPRTPSSKRLVRSSSVFFVLSEVPAFFGVLAAAIFSQMGLAAYGFLIIGVILAALLARQFSRSGVLAQQRSREMAQLEQLGRDIIAAPPDAGQLPALLSEHVPEMLQYSQVHIRLNDGQVLLHEPESATGPGPGLWPWLEEHPSLHQFEPGQVLPWTGVQATSSWILAPIHSVETQETLGGICLEQERTYAIDLRSDVFPALQVLAAQIASALHSAEVYQRTLAHQRTAQELAVAGEIQASFLPATLPEVPGWELAARLQPARQTSGDFFDIIPLPNGQVGLLVADVSDKGMGAALYMALTRTLLRTYAYEYHSRPDYVLRVANRRILADAQAGLFVSVFYGVIDPFTGALTYCNAGHNPPLWLSRAMTGTSIQRLVRTGMVLGVMEGVDWEPVTVHVHPDDVLFLYSDGVTDAQDVNGDFFGDGRLQQIVSAHWGDTADDIQQAVLDAVAAFTSQPGGGSVPQFDDITLMVLKRGR